MSEPRESSSGSDEPARSPWAPPLPELSRASESSPFAERSPPGELPPLDPPPSDQPPAGLPPFDSPPPRTPGALEVVSRGLDLAVSASGTVRRASLYAGGMFLLLLGPVALILALLIAFYGIDALTEIALGQAPAFGLELGAAPGALIIGGVAAVVISVDIQNLAVAIIHDQAATGRSSFRAALAAARRSFWRLIFASIASGVVVLVLTTILQRIVGIDGLQQTEGNLVPQTAIQLLVSLPFAYIGAAVVVGRAGPLEAVRTSVRLARRRWRLALVIGIVNTATALLGAVAIGAGSDILGRIAIGLGVGEEGSGLVGVVQLALIVAVGIAAIGSLSMTIAAMSVAPQVVAYRGLGGPERRDEPSVAYRPEFGPWFRPPDKPRGVPLIPIGMWLVLAALAVLTAASLAQFN